MDRAEYKWGSNGADAPGDGLERRGGRLLHLWGPHIQPISFQSGAHGKTFLSALQEGTTSSFTAVRPGNGAILLGSLGTHLRHSHFMSLFSFWSTHTPLYVNITLNPLHVTCL